ncbi:MAG TPA: hypothetical protein VMW50_13545 [Dehalococcoidia bacterium]|nr:hypothetical protein [Dehalococcoidia bacterium]
MDRWFVICLDDGKYVFATTRHFCSLKEAQDYKGTIASSREAIVVFTTKDIPNVPRNV